MQTKTNSGSSDATSSFGHHVLDIDCLAEAARIEEQIRVVVSRQLHRRGAIVAVSGGIDSSVCLALAVRSLGAARVLALLLPERDSPSQGTAQAQALCGHLGVEYRIEDITPALLALGCYRRRDEAIRKVFAQFTPGCRSKIVSPTSTWWWRRPMEPSTSSACRWMCTWPSWRPPT
jgi:NAD+ synthase